MHHYIRTRYQKFIQSSAKYDLRGFNRASGANGNNRNKDNVDDEPRRFVGKDLKAIRMKYNISQRCFAEMLDISVRTLQNYEIDHRSMPSTAVSLFIFADENIDLFKEYYLSQIEKIEPFRG